MSFSKRSLRLRPLAALVPIVFAGELLLPEHAALHLGVREALGCSGNGAGGGSGVAPPSGWTSLKPLLPARGDLGAVPIATDGFFTIQGYGYFLSNDEAEAGLEVAVKNEAGEAVPGTTKFFFNDGTYVFGWSAAAPLEKGAKLKAALSGAPTASSQVGGEFALAVVGEPTPLPAPMFELAPWFDFFRGAGDGQWLTCQASGPPVNCQSSTISVPATVERRTGAGVRWQLPPVFGGVLWKATVEIDDDVIARAPRSIVYFGDSAAGYESLGGFAFPNGKPTCITVSLTDLRTGHTTRAESCGPRQSPEYADSDTQLGQCSASPSAALTEAWCRLKQGSSSIAECVVQGGGGSGTGGATSLGGYPGTGGLVTDYFPGGTSTGPGSQPPHTSAGKATNDASEGNGTGDASGPRTSKGCQLGAPASSPMGSTPWTLLGLSLLLRRRWWQRA